MDNTNNKKFWEQYVEYFKNKVDESNLEHAAENKIPGDNLIGHYAEKLNILSDDRFLDFGCGLCRLYPYYKRLTNNACNYFGVDISATALSYAAKSYPELENSLLESDGKTIPCEDNAFQKVICFGVFDACNQETILKELLRVLDLNGEILITGKSTCYLMDDTEALTAEINAQKNHHPNYFTDIRCLLKQLAEQGIVVKQSFFFLKRGDFVRNEYVTEMPERFYEWAFILKKQSTEYIRSFQPFSRPYSDIYKKKMESSEKSDTDRRLHCTN